MALSEICRAWLMWAKSFLHDAAQLPYRVALTAFMAGAVISWFAARDWFTGGDTLQGRTVEIGGLAKMFSKEDLRVLAHEIQELVRLLDRRDGVWA